MSTATNLPLPEWKNIVHSFDRNPLMAHLLNSWISKVTKKDFIPSARKLVRRERVWSVLIFYIMLPLLGLDLLGFVCAAIWRSNNLLPSYQNMLLSVIALAIAFMAAAVFFSLSTDNKKFFSEEALVFPRALQKLCELVGTPFVDMLSYSVNRTRALAQDGLVDLARKVRRVEKDFDPKGKDSTPSHVLLQHANAKRDFENGFHLLQQLDLLGRNTDFRFYFTAAEEAEKAPA